MCSKECSDIQQHRDNECKLFGETGFKPNISSFGRVDPKASLDYAIITPSKDNLPDFGALSAFNSLCASLRSLFMCRDQNEDPLVCSVLF